MMTVSEAERAVAFARRDRNVDALEGRPWRAVPTAVRWCVLCAGFYAAEDFDDDAHRHHFPIRTGYQSGTLGCLCLVCSVVRSEAVRVEALVASATPAPAPKTEPWRPESREAAEKAIGRPLGPRERVRRTADGTILPPASFTITGELLNRLEVHARFQNMTREDALHDLLDSSPLA